MKRTFDETELAKAIFSVLHKKEIAKKAEVDLEEMKTLEVEYRTGQVLAGRDPYRYPGKPDGDRLDVLKERFESAATVMYELDASKRFAAREMAEAAFALQHGNPISQRTNLDDLKKLLKEATGIEEAATLDHALSSLGYGPTLRHYDHEWKTPLGFGPHLVPAGVTSILIQQPQLPVALRMLGIRSEVARHFQINEVRIGKDSQFVTAAPIDASLIWMLQMNGATCNVGQQVHLSVTNMDVFDHVFKAAILCDVRY
jgi:hypothetical protein